MHNKSRFERDLAPLSQLEFKAAVRSEQIRALYHAPAIMLVNPINASILAAVLWQEYPAWILLVWIGLFCVEPSRAVNTTACFPRGVFYNSRIGRDLPPSIQDSGRRSDRVYVGRRHFCGTKTADRIWGGVARACPKTRFQSGLQWALAHGPRWIPPKLPPGPGNK